MIGKSIAASGSLRVNDWSDEETADPLYADDRNFYKVEKWTKEGTKVDSLLYAGNNLDKAQDILYEVDKAPAPDQADNPAADADTGSMAAEVSTPGVHSGCARRLRIRELNSSRRGVT